MALPHFNSRQWFWGVMLGVFLWAWVGTRTEGAGGAGNLTVMQRVQGWVKWPVDTVMTPGSVIAAGGERTFAWMVEAATTTHRQTRSNEALEIEVKDLNAQLKTDEGIIQDLQQKLSDLGYARDARIPGEALLSADVVNYGAGVGNGVITINRGWAQHVQEKMPVIAHQYVVGRVAEVGEVSTVRLLTSLQSGVQAMIVREGVPAPLLNKPCYVQGAGDGQLICRSVDASAIVVMPRKGDLVELNDPDWPLQLQHWVIGEVEEVGKSRENLLRYGIRIRPRANVGGLSAVTVLRLK